MKPTLKKSERGEKNADASPREGALAWGKREWLQVFVLVIAVVAAYANSFSGPFIFDDDLSIVQNPTIRHLSGALSPPRGDITVSGRPLLNLSLAINYQLGKTAVGGYHAGNLLIHILAGLTLFGIVRRTLARPGLRERFGDPWLPFFIALLWCLHPLQTAGVTYIIQRAESLMGLCYLLTIYCSLRAMESRVWIWPLLAVAACLGGMATKAVMVSAPLMVLLYDRTFAAGTFREALRLRWRLYLGLAATWLLLAWLLKTSGVTQTGTAGFESGNDWRRYGLTQLWAVPHYLWLSLWPHPLVLDYGGKVFITSPTQLLPGALVLFLLLTGTVISLRRWPAAGFAGCWFFGILALTSSVFPLSDTIFEHRMYLSLAAVIVLLVFAVHSWVGPRSRVLFVAVALVFGFLTARRNHDYRSDLAIWTDTIRKRPGNARAHNNLGAVLLRQGKADEALAEFQEALRLDPNYALAQSNVGQALQEKGRGQEAMDAYRKAIEKDPHNFDAQNNLGTALERQGNLPEAIEHYREASRLAPDNPEILNNLGVALAKSGRLQDAIPLFQTAMRVAPDHAKAYGNFANALSAQGKVSEAIPYYRQSLQLHSDNAETHNNLGNALAGTGKLDEAIAEYRQAIELNPRYINAYYGLGIALAKGGAFDAAAGAFEQALRLDPGSVRLHKSLGVMLASQGKWDGAIAQYTEALRLGPNDAETHLNLGRVLIHAGRTNEAIVQIREALRLRPDYPEARQLMQESGVGGRVE